MARFTFTVPVQLCSEAPGRDCVAIAHVRPGWTMPTPPAPGRIAVVHDTGDGWCTSWEGPDGEEGDLIVGDEYGWPFVEDTATAGDWEAAGWVVL